MSSKKIIGDRHILNVIGKTRRGKSHLTKEMIIPLLRTPVIIMDSENEYEGKSFSSPEVFFESIESTGEIQESTPNVIKINSKLQASKLFRYIRKIRVPISLVIEECSKYTSPNYVDPWLEKLMLFGGHHDVSIVSVAQRFAKIHNDIEGCADFRISFQQDLPPDIRRVADYTENTDIVKDLDRRQFICFGEIRDPFKEAGFQEGKVLTLTGNKIKQVKK